MASRIKKRSTSAPDAPKVIAQLNPSSGLIKYPVALSESPEAAAAPSATTTEPSHAVDDVPDYQRAIARPDGREDEDYNKDVENLTFVFAAIILIKQPQAGDGPRLFLGSARIHDSLVCRVHRILSRFV
jgi:hypothetical protein